ncbi:DUF4153 domain-containing protein [Prolixibacteraceae bacterium JC049]|nr:DUF4153 domain-containing protein [Prolixibacteraceae bacterium JC049]
MLKEKIKTLIDNPEGLEQLYQQNKKEFKQELLSSYQDETTHPAIAFWKARLLFQPKRLINERANKAYLINCIIVAIGTIFLIKLPLIFGFESQELEFLIKNMPLIMLLGLTVFSLSTKSNIDIKKLLYTIAIYTVSAVVINLIAEKGSTSPLVYIHIPIFIWFVYGWNYSSYSIGKKDRLDFLKHNGDIAILSAVFAISGGILTMITIVLFSGIGKNITNFYIHNIIIPGITITPIASALILKYRPQITNKISSIVAILFSPLMLITLLIFLTTIIIEGESPYTKRESLFTFNIMLVPVLAIIFFSVSELRNNNIRKYLQVILLALSTITLFIDLVALSAIIYRFIEFGISPNRLTVLGFNILTCIHLFKISINLYKSQIDNDDEPIVANSIAHFLPFYMAWTFVVAFLFPIIFSIN